MRVLAFDTATAATAVALRDMPGGPVDLEARDDPPAGARPGHAARLLELIESVIDRGGGWSEVDRIAVGVGPGTFTGLRIGVATAHGLARSRGIPLVGVSTLQSLACGAAAADASVLAVIDARRGEAFAAGWAAGADPAVDPPALPPCVLPPEELASAASRLGPGVRAAGDGALHFRPVLERVGALVFPDGSPHHRVSAREHCRLAVALTPGSVDSVLPAYLRLPDAELARPETGG
jgi:tRNA threonylcarbamoyladenosine biosynthesis protein TsaB